MSVLPPICVPCRLEMRCVKNQRLVRDPPAASGPSTYWYGDEFECPDCRHRIVTGFGKPLGPHPLGGADDGVALQFDYERPHQHDHPSFHPGLTLHLELRAASGPAEDVTGDIPLWLPVGMDPAEIGLSDMIHIPLLAFGDVRKIIALLTVSWDGPKLLKAVGRGPSPDYEDARLWTAVAEGEVNASVCLVDRRPSGQWNLLAISLELAVAAEQPAAEDQQRGGEDDGRG